MSKRPFIQVISDTLGEKGIAELDQLPSWEDKRRKMLAEKIRELAGRQEIDVSHALVAEQVANVSFDRDRIDYDPQKDDLPGHITNLDTKGLIALIDEIHQCIPAVRGISPVNPDDDEWVVEFVVWSNFQRAAWGVIERLKSTPPIVAQTLTGVTTTENTPSLFPLVGISGIPHVDAGWGTLWDISFPEGTRFAPPVREEDKSSSQYHIDVHVPAQPEDVTISLVYSPIWHPQHPWQLIILDFSGEMRALR
jgi:hypothetical protein